MSKTLSLNRRAHLFVRDDALFIKLQTPHNKMPDKADIYIQASESSNVKKD